MNYKLDVLLSPELEKYRDRIEATIKPYIKISIENNSQVSWWQSKFGGLPYLPKEFEYPITADGDYLFLLAQINFAEVPPLEGFPEKGILQFYIGDNDVYGFGFDDSTMKERFKTLYFAEPNLTLENITTDFDFLSKPEYFPIEGYCSLQFTRKYAPISPYDYQFQKLMGEEFADLFRWDDEYLKISDSGGHKIGGYPFFTQSDIRINDLDNEQLDILLLQIDSDNNKAIDIMWGDMGVGNFFIRESELKQLDFSHVVYNWDCC
jgi:uncharacterized protein YwqG